jgi:hypothetical protein
VSCFRGRWPVCGGGAPFWGGGVLFSDKEKMGRQIVPFFNGADTDFSLWHANSSWSLDA